MKNIIITEEQLKIIVESEYYNSEKLYAKSYIQDRLKKAPRYIKKYATDLEEIEKDGKIFVKIPQVLYQYLFGSF
jgi:hypothetical protein